MLIYFFNPAGQDAAIVDHVGFARTAAMTVENPFAFIGKTVEDDISREAGITMVPRVIGLWTRGSCNVISMPESRTEGGFKTEIRALAMLTPFPSLERIHGSPPRGLWMGSVCA